MVEDRKVNGFCETIFVSSNIFVGHLATTKRVGFIGGKRQSESVAQIFIKLFKIRGTSPRSKVIELSGGNQQKVVLARSLTREKDGVNFDEPTRGFRRDR